MGRGARALLVLAVAAAAAGWGGGAAAGEERVLGECDEAGPVAKGEEFRVGVAFWPGGSADDWIGLHPCRPGDRAKLVRRLARRLPAPRLPPRLPPRAAPPPPPPHPPASFPVWGGNGASPARQAVSGAGADPVEGLGH